jgi:dipeptide/tripeptide permease
MNSLFAVFLIICGVGFLFLMISLLIGDLFEAFDFDLDIDGSDGNFGMLDSRVISVFLTAFGAMGALTMQFGYGPLAAVGAGIGSGLLFGALVFAFGYLLYSQQSTSNVGNRDLVGRTAKVVVGIKPGELGQISCTVGEERIEKLARVKGDVELKEGETVFIEEAGTEAFIVSSMKGYELPE